MKKILVISSLLFFGFVQAQLTIGKETPDGNGLLDFGTDNKGIILPVVDVQSSNSYSNGTILFDNTDKKVKVLQDDIWLELSDEGSILQQNNSSNVKISTARELNNSDDDGLGVVIGASSSTVDGILVLESEDHALVLPKVENPHLTILSPTAGTMVYDTYSNSLAVFDGMVWSYWR